MQWSFVHLEAFIYFSTEEVWSWIPKVAEAGENKRGFCNIQYIL